MPPKKSPSREKAFTLIEVIVVLSTLAFTLPIVTLILFVIIRQQISVSRMTESKRQGDRAVTYIQNVLSSEVVGMYSSLGGEVCASDVGVKKSISYFKDNGGNTIVFSVNAGTLNITRAGVTEPITSASRVIIENANNPPNTYPFTIECIRKTSYASPVVSVSFAVVPFGNFSTAELTAMRLHYSTMVIIRNR